MNDVKPKRVRMFFDFECPYCGKEQERSLADLKAGKCIVRCSCGEAYFVERVAKVTINRVLYRDVVKYKVKPSGGVVQYKTKPPVEEHGESFEKAVAIVKSMQYNGDMVETLAEEVWVAGEREKEELVRYILANIDRDEV